MQVSFPPRQSSRYFPVEVVQFSKFCMDLEWGKLITNTSLTITLKGGGGGSREEMAC